MNRKIVLAACKLYHELTLNYIVSELYKSKKVEQYTSSNDYKIEFSDSTIYFNAKRDGKELSNIHNIHCSKWIGRWNSSSVISRGDMSKASLLMVLDLVYPSV